jgi:hypothetical protein
MTKYIDHPGAPGCSWTDVTDMDRLQSPDVGGEASIKRIKEIESDLTLAISRFLANPRPLDWATLSVVAVSLTKRGLAFLQPATWRARTTLGSILFLALAKLAKSLKAG